MENVLSRGIKLIMRVFKFLPYYYEEMSEELKNPDGDYYLGENILSKYPKIKNNIGIIEEKEMRILLEYMEQGICTGSSFGTYDVIDGTTYIPYTPLSDGIYCWRESHIYYMKKYHLDLPESFKKYVFLLNGNYEHIKK